MAKALTYLEIVERFKTCRENDPYTLLTENDPSNPIRSRTEVTLRHDKCGNTISTRFQHFINDGKGACRICNPIIPTGNSTKPISEEEMAKRIADKHPSVKYKEGYNGMKKRCTFIHTECGTEYTAVPSDLTRRGTGCPKCANKVRGKYVQSETYLEDIIEADYEWLEPYKGDNKLMHSIRHIICKHEYKVRPNDFQQGYRCPECANRLAPLESRNAKRIEKALIEYGLTFHKEYIDKRCKSDIGGQLRFDFAIEYDPGIFIIIEYDGEFHDVKPSRLHEKGAIQSKTLAESIRTNTIRRDKCKDKFVKDHPEKYLGIHRITHKDPVIETLNEILGNYYEL